MSITELARESGITKMAIYTWINGKHDPSPESLRTIAGVLDDQVSARDVRRMIDNEREANGT